MKVLHKIFLILCRVFNTLWKKRHTINLDVDNDGITDIKIEIGTNSDSEREVNKDEN